MASTEVVKAFFPAQDIEAPFFDASSAGVCDFGSGHPSCLFSLCKTVQEALNRGTPSHHPFSKDFPLYIVDHPFWGSCTWPRQSPGSTKAHWPMILLNALCLATLAAVRCPK